MHAQAAELLREEDALAAAIASQLLHAMPAAKAWRVAHLRQAAVEARASGAPEAASSYLRRALIEPPRQEQRYDVLLEPGMSELHHDPRASADHFVQAHDEAASTEARSAAEVDDADNPFRRKLDSARLVFARWDYASQELRHELFADLRNRADAGAELDRDERANLAHELAARGEDLHVAANCARLAIRDSATVSGTDAAFVLELTSVLVICDRFGEADEIALRAVSHAEARGSPVDASAALTLATYVASVGEISGKPSNGRSQLSR